MRFEVLGPLRAPRHQCARASEQRRRSASTRWAEAAGGARRSLLAEPNTTVSVERLIDLVWGESPPESACHTPQSYVSELRKSVGEVIGRSGAGYVIRVDHASLDSLEFEARAGARHAPSSTRSGSRARRAGCRASLWRAQPFADFPDQPGLQAEQHGSTSFASPRSSRHSPPAWHLGGHVSVAAELERSPVSTVPRGAPGAAHARAVSVRTAGRRTPRPSRRHAIARRGPRHRAVAATAAPRGADPVAGLRISTCVAGALCGPADRTAAGREPLPRPARVPRGRSVAVLRSGRQLIAQLVERVTGPRTVHRRRRSERVGQVERGAGGPRAAAAPDIPDVTIAMMQPGAQPFAVLEAALDRARGERRLSTSRLRGQDAGSRRPEVVLAGAGSSRLLLVVDQFEELFTIVDASEAARFLALLAEAAARMPASGPRARHVRADFYDGRWPIPRIGPAVRRQRRQRRLARPRSARSGGDAARPPARHQRRAASGRPSDRRRRRPAERAAAVPVRADRAVRRTRRGRVLDLATYERIGGVRKAVARRAESLYGQLRRPEQETARQLFLRIATVSGDLVGGDVSRLGARVARRRRRRAAERRSMRSPATASSPSTAIRRRRPTVEVAHEALLAEWHRLRDWIEESRDDLAKHARLCAAHARMGSVRRDSGYLLTGSRLDDYERWAATSQLKLTATELPSSSGGHGARAPRRCTPASASREAAPAPAPIAAAARDLLVAIGGARRHRRVSDSSQRRRPAAADRGCPRHRPADAGARSTSSSHAGWNQPWTTTG